MPSVMNTRRTKWFSPARCNVCNKAVWNVPALASHLRTHSIDMRTNPKPTKIAASIGMFGFPSSPNFHESLLSPSSFSPFETNNGLVTNPNTSYHHHAALSPTMATTHEPNTGFNGSMKSFNNMFALMETQSNLYNVVPYNMDTYPHVLYDGVTRPFICQLDRPVPVIIELDSDGEENEVANEEMLDLSLKL